MSNNKKLMKCGFIEGGIIYHKLRLNFHKVLTDFGTYISLSAYRTLSSKVLSDLWNSFSGNISVTHHITSSPL